LQSLKPAEVVFQRNQQKHFKEYFGTKFFTYALDEWIFAEAYATESLLKHFGTHSLKGFGVDGLKEGTIAAGAILHYLKDTEHPNLGSYHFHSTDRQGRTFVDGPVYDPEPGTIWRCRWQQYLTEGVG
jgi:DNA mismatch repair ATPase MutS